MLPLKGREQIATKASTITFIQWSCLAFTLTTQELILCTVTCVSVHILTV